MLKLEEKQTDNKIKFKDVNIGVVFSYGSSYFMRTIVKTAPVTNAVRLSNGAGALVFFADDDMCLVVDATLVIGG